MAPSVVFVVSAVASHIYSTLGLARQLGALGWSVDYWGEASTRRLIHGQGFAHQEIEPVWLCYERIWPGARRNGLVDAVRRFEQSIDRLLARQVPDLVILDPLALAYFPLLRARGLKCVVLQDKPLPTADPIVPPPTSALIPRDTVLGRAQVRLRWGLERGMGFARRVGQRAIGLMGAYTSDQLVRAVGSRAGDMQRASRPSWRVTYDLHFADLDEWVLGAPEADLPRIRPLPSRVRYVGPWVDARRGTGSSPVRRAPHTSHFIYVSMGATMPHWSTDIAILQRIIEAFGGVAGVQVVVATGNLKARAALTNGHANVQLFMFLPQLSVLRDADLAIIHAGANSVRECIATNTPMLAFPREFDQRGNAARIVYHGMGLRGSRRFATPASIRAGALRILEDSRYERRVRALNEIGLAAQSTLLAEALRSVVPRITASSPARPAIAR